MKGDVTARDLSREAAAAAALVAGLADADAETIHDTVEGETGLLEAIDQALSEMDECEIIIAGCKAKADEISKRLSRVEERKSRLRALIERALVMAEIQSARLPTATLSVRNNSPKAIPVNESLIPSEFWSPQPPKLDTAALNKAAANRHIPGVEMTNGSVSLQIRRT